MSDHTTALPAYDPQPEPRRPRGGTAAVIASVVVVVLVAVGGFAAWRWFNGAGPRPAEVLPASTFALISIDLDPSGGQKVEAIKTLRKFPGFRDKVGLKPDSDPLERLFREAKKDEHCKSLDYDRDLKSWIGQRLGLGGVQLDGKITPVATLQVTDADNAKSNFPSLAKCLEMKHYGWTVTDDYVVISDTTPHAKSIVAAGEKSPLSEDADYKKWTDEAGGAGIMNAYVGPKTVSIVADQLRSGDDVFGMSDDLGPQGGKQLADALDKYKDFQGAAAVLRFADGGIELSSAGGGGKATKANGTVANQVAAMPGDTALLFAAAVPPGAFDMIEKATAPGDNSSDLLGAMLGIDFPEDLKTLLGKSLSLSLGGDAPDDLSTIKEPSDISVGALIEGDSAKIDAVIAKIEKTAGVGLDDLQVTKSSKDGKVAIASNSDYADQLLGTGSLSEDAGFKDAVPHAKDSQVILYADADGEWGKALLKTIREQGSDDDQEFADNLAVVRALGMSAWTEDGISHGLVRLSLK
jgi:hypothetical protein